VLDPAPGGTSGRLQTPQVFRLGPLVTRPTGSDPLRSAASPTTPRCSKWQGAPVRMIPGDPRSTLKVTYPEDLELAERPAQGVRARARRRERSMSTRVGFGYDVHRLEPGRPMRVACVELPFDRGPLGHSDGDVAAHRRGRRAPERGRAVRTSARTSRREIRAGPGRGRPAAGRDAASARGGRGPAAPGRRHDRGRRAEDRAASRPWMRRAMASAPASGSIRRRSVSRGAVRKAGRDRPRRSHRRLRRGPGGDEGTVILFLARGYACRSSSRRWKAIRRAAPGPHCGRRLAPLRRRGSSSPPGCWRARFHLFAGVSGGPGGPRRGALRHSGGDSRPRGVFPIWICLMRLVLYGRSCATLLVIGPSGCAPSGSDSPCPRPRSGWRSWSLSPRWRGTGGGGRSPPPRAGWPVSSGSSSSS